MRCYLIGFLLSFSFVLKINAQITLDAEPSWIHNINYTNTDINIDEVSSGTYILLFDTQTNIPKQVSYNRLTIKITDNVGIQDASTINVNYDPKYQKLKFHKINVIRNNEVINKLDINNFQVMRRELNAENHLYDGSLSAVMNISDVRTGDIIDYSYSITGFNPIHRNIFSDHFYLNDYESVGEINRTIFSKNKLNYKAFNTALKPTILKTNNLYSYNWHVKETAKLDYEENTPIWKLIYKSVIVSEFNSWKEVVNWGTDVFNINDDISLELRQKIDEINTADKTQGEKIKATLDFVQNDIRYLGIESGIGSYKPFSPNKVFKQRFGDCKDKSLLVVTMLNKMNIEAFPMLVNTTLKHTIKELLPSPKFFDHCVVKVITEKSNYYYDPTIPNQGGDYDSTYFPNYSCGLVLKNGNDDLDTIKSHSENKVETFEEYTIDTIGKGANLKVITTYYESEADNMRNYFKNNSINNIKKEYESFYSKYYFNVSSVKSPKFEDEKYRNIFKVFEEYKIDSIWQPMVEKENHIAVSFLPTSLTNLLYIPKKEKRASEVSVIYPIVREHHIKINLPLDWGIKNENLNVNSPGFYYEWKAKYNAKEKVINLNYYLKTQKDHITTSEYSQYIKDIKKVDQTTGYYIYIPKDQSQLTALTGDNFIFKGFIKLMKIILIIGGIIVIALFGFWFANKRKGN